ncbi:MAG TPA: DNA primase [Candidatus Saccharimonadales bacterium]|nr:DNA primase [Candidatus Saccharimonadales bacterium]
MERSSQIDEVKSKIDIVQLVGGYVALKKAGRNYKGLCPFHSEKTPSFMVSAERQIFKCFGCNEGGDAITFYQKIEGLEFGQALKALADKVGVRLADYQPNPAEKQRDTFLQINEKTAEFYHYLLAKHPSGKKALEYLKNRGLNEKTIDDWQLGFAPDSWDTTFKFLIKKKFEPKDITASGIALPSTGRGAYDRFRKRIMFPIRNIAGSTVAFSGRIFGEGEPKYLNSPDNLLFNKSNNLFGIDKAKIEIKRENQAVLVEGNLDVISSHQAGVTNVVAPLGTALTEKQVDLMRRFASELVVSFDQDSAGYAASLRVVELAEKAGLTLKLTEIAGKDPDELIKKDPKAWKEAIKNSVPIYDFLINNLLERYSNQSPESFRKITKEILPYLNKIDNELTLSHYERLLATKLSVSEESVKKELAKQGSPTPVKGEEKVETEKKIIAEKIRVETYLLELILQSQTLPKEVSSEDFEVRRLRNIFEILQKSSTNFQFSLKSLKVPEELQEIFDRLTLAELASESVKNSQSLQREIDTCVRRLKELNLRTELKKVSLAIKQAEIARNNSQIDSLSKNFQELSEQLALLEKEKEFI